MFTDSSEDIGEKSKLGLSKKDILKKDKKDKDKKKDKGYVVFEGENSDDEGVFAEGVK